jgi:hypothetical protein
METLGNIPVLSAKKSKWVTMHDEWFKITQ